MRKEGKAKNKEQRKREEGKQRKKRKKKGNERNMVLVFGKVLLFHSKRL